RPGPEGARGDQGGAVAVPPQRLPAAADGRLAGDADGGAAVLAAAAGADGEPAARHRGSGRAVPADHERGRQGGVLPADGRAAAGGQVELLARVSSAPRPAGLGHPAGRGVFPGTGSTAPRASGSLARGPEEPACPHSPAAWRSPPHCSPPPRRPGPTTRPTRW